MSLLVYNNVRLDLVKLHGWHREAIYNGNQYLYTRNTISVLASLNPALSNYSRGIQEPAATSIVPPFATGPALNTQTPAAKPATTPYNNQSGNFGTNIVQVPNLGMVTDESIKHALLQPRQQLIYGLLGYPIVFCPWPGYVTDATGGPLPLKCDVISMQGGKTFIIEYIIQFDINECPRYTDKPGPLQSHTWSMSHSIDPDCFCVRTITGRAVFLRDVVEKYALQAAAGAIGGGVVPGAITQFPDQFREALLHPIPTNFKREKVEVSLQPDGVTLDYVIVDRELALNINIPNVTRVEGSHTITTSWGGMSTVWEVQKEALIKAAKLTTKTAQAFEANALVDPAAVGLPVLAATAAAAEVSLGIGIGLLEGLIPQVVQDITIRVWGNRNSSRSYLTAQLYGLLSSRLSAGVDVTAQLNNALNAVIGTLGPGVVPPQLTQLLNDLRKGNAGAAINMFGNGIIATYAALGGFKLSITHDIANKYVEGHFVTLGSPYSLMTTGVSTLGLLVGDDDTSYRLIGVNGGNQTGIQNSPWDGRQGFPSSDTSRGTYLEILATQALYAPCQPGNTPPTGDNTKPNPKTSIPPPYVPKPPTTDKFTITTTTITPTPTISPGGNTIDSVPSIGVVGDTMVIPTFPNGR